MLQEECDSVGRSLSEECQRRDFIAASCSGDECQ